MKDFKGRTFPLKNGMVIFYDRRTKAFLAGLSLMENFYWHFTNKKSERVATEKCLSYRKSRFIAQLAASVAGLKISTGENKKDLFIFPLKTAEIQQPQLKDGMILFYNQQTKAFLAGSSLMDDSCWHIRTSKKSETVSKEKLSFQEAEFIARLAANVAGLEVSDGKINEDLFIFFLRNPEQQSSQ